jgi:hypothetical protein
VVVDAKDIMRSDVQAWIDEFKAMPKKKRKKIGLGDFLRDKVETEVDGNKYATSVDADRAESDHLLHIIMADIESYDAPSS